FFGGGDYGYGFISQTGGSTTPSIHARTVVVNAASIDVDGTISVGSNWSVYLPASLTAPVTVTPAKTYTFCFFGCYSYTVAGSVTGGPLAVYDYDYQHFGGSPSETIPGLSGIVSGNALINATYNAQTNTITLDNVNAAQAGASVILQGQIYSTNTLGNISVNGGLGNVQVNNQTGVPLVVQNIVTGNVLSSTVTAAQQAKALNSVVEIQDLLKNQTTFYVFTPGATSIDEYVMGGASSDLTYSGTPTQIINSTSTSYQPEQGLRFNWAEAATMSRSININWSSDPVSDWVWGGNSANPWLFIPADQAQLYQSFYGSSSGAVLASGVSAGWVTTTTAGSQAGYLTDNDPNHALPIFQQTIAATYSGGETAYINYHGCNNGTGGDCNYGFDQTSTSGSPYAQWRYYYPTNAALVMQMSVKADNSFGISFGGNASGFVSIISNAPVTIEGSINNPTGATDITATGSITESATTLSGAQQSVVTNSLNLNATGGIGSASVPFGVTFNTNPVLAAQ